MGAKSIDSNQVISILKKAESNEKLTTLERGVLYRFFVDFVKEEKIDEVLKKDLGEENYRALVELAKKDNEDYYSLKQLKENASDKFVDVLTLLFNRGVVVCDLSVLSDLEKQYGKKIIRDVRLILLRICEYCLKNNYPGEAASSVLLNYYNCPIESSLLISESINNNRTSLQLNFLIKLGMK